MSPTDFILGPVPAENARETPEVQALLAACPTLESRLNLDDGAYIVMGSVGRMIRDRELTDAELDCVFEVFNRLAELETSDLDLLGAGALEILNDDAPTARFARSKLRGKALEMVEALRIGWGQPDYSA
ncbi:MAG: hypothetical protein Q7U20_00165 [Caulobacter sp.]|nr:hypothetical protein [Caulobacter sp.]